MHTCLIHTPSLLIFEITQLNLLSPHPREQRHTIRLVRIKRSLSEAGEGPLSNSLKVEKSQNMPSPVAAKSLTPQNLEDVIYIPAVRGQAKF